MESCIREGGSPQGGAGKGTDQHSPGEGAPCGAAGYLICRNRVPYECPNFKAIRAVVLHKHFRTLNKEFPPRGQLAGSSDSRKNAQKVTRVCSHAIQASPWCNYSIVLSPRRIRCRLPKHKPRTIDKKFVVWQPSSCGLPQFLPSKPPEVERLQRGMLCRHPPEGVLRHQGEENGPPGDRSPPPKTTWVLLPHTLNTSTAQHTPRWSREANGVATTPNRLALQDGPHRRSRSLYSGGNKGSRSAPPR